MTMRGMARVKAAVLGVAALGVCALGGCTHVKGQVFDARTKAPLTGVTFTVGRPDSFAIYSKHPVDGEGKFDFSIAPTDEPYLYLWDGQGDPELRAMHIPEANINDHMRVFYQSGGVEDW